MLTIQSADFIRILNIKHRDLSDEISHIELYLTKKMSTQTITPADHVGLFIFISTLDSEHNLKPLYTTVVMRLSENKSKDLPEALYLITKCGVLNSGCYQRIANQTEHRSLTESLRLLNSRGLINQECLYTILNYQDDAVTLEVIKALLLTGHLSETCLVNTVHHLLLGESKPNDYYLIGQVIKVLLSHNLKLYTHMRLYNSFIVINPGVPNLTATIYKDLLDKIDTIKQKTAVKNKEIDHSPQGLFPRKNTLLDTSAQGEMEALEP